MRPRLLSLCTGYGGLDHAAEDVFDAELVAVSDIDPGANKILAHRYPNVPNLGDLKLIDWDAWAGVEIMTAGYPCQPFSHAGKRAGTDDPRHIFPWIVEGIRRVGPRLVLLENVRGHLVLGFPEVLGTLADIGYDARWVCLRASDVGACHKRERLFIAAADAHLAGLGRIGRLDTVGRDADGRGRADGLRRAGQPETLLKTPTAQLAVNGGSQHPDKRKAGGHGPTLADEIEFLLPTPRVSMSHGPSRAELDAGDPYRRLETDVETMWMLPTPRATRGGSATETMYGLGAERSDANRPQGEVLLPTPTSSDYKGSTKTRQQEGMHRHQLDAVTEGVTDFGKYAAAIARQEAAFGYPTPPPTEVGPKGGHRLSPRFVEWMQGCEPGWVTDVPGLTRNDQLKALGNGVVRQQAAAAIRYITTPLEAVA
jgi:DNA (cytosine-5)-methyltransferase 1